MSRLTIEDFNTIENKSNVYYNGSKWETNNFGKLTIIAKSGNKDKYDRANKYICQFEDGTIVEAIYGHIKEGVVRNPNKPTIHNVGYIGQGKWRSSINSIKTKEWMLFENVISRCYSDIFHKNRPTYKGCIVKEEWHNFQNFCEDIQKLEGYSEWKNSDKKIILDKDILCDKLEISPKMYSKDTCIFITLAESNSEMNKRGKITGLTYVATRILDGLQKEFTNQSEFANKNNLSPSKVWCCIHGRRKTHKGWTFKIKGD